MERGSSRLEKAVTEAEVAIDMTREPVTEAEVAVDVTREVVTEVLSTA